MLRPRLRRTALLSSTVLALAGLAAVPAASSAVTFGSDLSRPADSPYDCTIAPSTIGGPLEGFVPSGAQTCTWWTTGANLGSDLSEGHVVPHGGGTITKARVKVGPVTGPMQIVVLRSLRHPASLDDPACCFPVGDSDVFTPQANGITEVPMNVEARHDTDPASGLNNYDHIALSVLEPGVPVPAEFTGVSLDGPVGGAFYPHYEPGTERTTGLGSLVGFQVLIDADIDQSDPGDGTPTGPTDIGGLVAPVGLGGGVAPVKRFKAAVPLVCTSPEECAGLVRLQKRALTRVDSSGLRRTTRRAGGRTFGKSAFTIPAGETDEVKVKLNKKGRRLVKKKKRAKVYANVRLSTGETLSEKIKLKRRR